MYEEEGAEVGVKVTDEVNLTGGGGYPGSTGGDQREGGGDQEDEGRPGSGRWRHG